MSEEKILWGGAGADRGGQHQPAALASTGARPVCGGGNSEPCSWTEDRGQKGELVKETGEAGGGKERSQSGHERVRCGSSIERHNNWAKTDKAVGAK
jgi:hypothetical protein